MNLLKSFYYGLITESRKPLLSAIASNRLSGWFGTGFILIHLIISFFGISIWQCPIRTYLGFPCPGCGLSRATLLLLQGKWEMSLKEHALAPFFLIGIIIITVVTLLPEKQYQKTIKQMTIFEKRSGFSGYFMGIVLLYWLLR